MSDPALSDEELVAYLDGELDTTRRHAVNAALTQCDDTQKRLDALRVDTEAIRHAFDGLSRSAPSAPPQVMVRSQSRLGRLNPFGAAVIGAVMAASVGMVFWPGQREGWHDYVASYQALYVEATLAHLDPVEGDQRVELTRIAKAIGRDVPFDVLTGAERLEYKRAQVLGFEARPLVQLAFVSDDGSPYALCIIQREEGAGEPVTLSRMEGLSVATWSRGDYAYMLIGGTDDALVSAEAQRFSALL